MLLNPTLRIKDYDDDDGTAKTGWNGEWKGSSDLEDEYGGGAIEVLDIAQMDPFLLSFVGR